MPDRSRRCPKPPAEALRALAGAFLLLLLVIRAAAGQAADVAAETPPCGVWHPSDARVLWTCRVLPEEETLERLFGGRWIDVARFNRIDRRHARPGVALKVPRRFEDVAGFSPLPGQYEPARTEAKFILVDLAEQFLVAYEYGRLVFSAPVTTGIRASEPPRASSGSPPRTAGMRPRCTRSRVPMSRIR